MISVIIPVYNTEKYLHKCIDSVLGQTYKELEVILVDDGSRDRSGDICDEYQRKDSRVVVIHQENRGVSVARNYALGEARGEWISFVDSDDWLEPDMYETLLETAVKYDAGISVCDVFEETGDGSCHRNIWESLAGQEEYVFQDTDRFLYGFSYTPVLWNKLIRRDLIQNQFWETCRYGEDTLFLVLPMLKAQKAAVTRKPLYHYRQEREGNVVSAGLDERTLHLARSYALVAEVIRKEGAEEAAAHIVYIAALQMIQKIRVGALGAAGKYLAAVKALVHPYRKNMNILAHNPRTSAYRRGLVRCAAAVPEFSVIVWNVTEAIKRLSGNIRAVKRIAAIRVTE